jgi:hypothetical protein
LPSNLKGGAAQKVAAKQIAGGLAKEIKTKAGLPLWRRDGDSDQAYSLRLSAAGAKAIAVSQAQGLKPQPEAPAQESLPDSMAGEADPCQPNRKRICSDAFHRAHADSKIVPRRQSVNADSPIMLAMNVTNATVRVSRRQHNISRTVSAPHDPRYIVRKPIAGPSRQGRRHRTKERRP